MVCVGIACSSSGEDPKEDVVTATSLPLATSTPTSASALVVGPVATAKPSNPATNIVPPGEFGGGMLRFSVPEPGPHFDIHREVSPAISTWGIGLIYSRIFRNADSGSANLVECELCESWEYVDADNLRIKLRPDITWQDIDPLNGRRLVAADVAFSLDRQRAPGNPNGDRLTGGKTISVVADVTFNMSLTPGGLNADLLLNLADGRTRIVAPEAVAINGDLIRGPNVGSGPWVWVETTAQTAAYNRNTTYFESGEPGIDGLRISYISNQETRMAAYRTGLLDIVDTVISADVTKAHRRLSGATSVLITTPGSGVEIALNTTEVPFDSLLFRRAVFRAMDPWEDIDQIWDGGGLVTLGIPVPRASWLLSQDAMRTAFADIERAGELLSQSGISQGLPIEITVGQFGDRYLLQAQRVAQALGLLGYDTTIREVTTREFADDVWIGGDYHVFVGAQAPVDGVNNDLFSIHHSSGLWNTTGFSTDELDELIEMQAAQVDQSDRRRTLLDAQFRILEGAHRFTVSARQTYWLAREWVGEFDPDTTRGENSWLSKLTLADHEEI